MVFEKLRDLICDEFEFDAEYITMQSNLMTDFGFDELDIADLSMSVEDVFEVEMPFDDEELEKIKTVGDLVNYIEKNIK